MAGGNRTGAIELFGQHRPHQEMRPGARAERQYVVGTGNDRRVQPLGAADEETQRAGCAQPAVEQRGEPFAVGRTAAEVERHRERVVRQGGEDSGALASLDLGGRAARLRDLGQRERWAQASGITSEQRGFRAVAQPAYRNHTHGSALVANDLVNRIAIRFTAQGPARSASS